MEPAAHQHRAGRPCQRDPRAHVRAPPVPAGRGACLRAVRPVLAAVNHALLHGSAPYVFRPDRRGPAAGYRHGRVPRAAVLRQPTRRRRSATGETGNPALASDPPADDDVPQAYDGDAVPPPARQRPAQAAQPPREGLKWGPARQTREGNRASSPCSAQRRAAGGTAYAATRRAARCRHRASRADAAGPAARPAGPARLAAATPAAASEEASRASVNPARRRGRSAAASATADSAWAASASTPSSSTCASGAPAQAAAWISCRQPSIRATVRSAGTGCPP